MRSRPLVGFAGDAGIFDGGDQTGVAQYFLHLLKVDTGLDQVSGITVPQ